MESVGVCFVQLFEHRDSIEVARVVAIATHAAARNLLAENFHLAADDVEQRPHDVAAQRRPAIDRHHRGNVIDVQFRASFAFARSFDLGDRQQFETRQVLRGEDQLDTHLAELNFLFVPAAIFVG